jgi:hypothetical protein
VTGRGEESAVSRFQFFRTDLQRVRWRLLGGNNRVLGVSLRALGDQAAALEEVDLVRKCVDEAEFQIDHVHSGQWWWRMRPAGQASELAGSAHGFARRVDAALSSRRFRQRAPQADVDLTLVVFQPGRRGREVPFDEDYPKQASPRQPSPGSTAMWPQHLIG